MLCCVAPYLRTVNTALLLITPFKVLRVSQPCYEDAAAWCAGINCLSSLILHGDSVMPARDLCNLPQRLHQHSKRVLVYKT